MRIRRFGSVAAVAALALGACVPQQPYYYPEPAPVSPQPGHAGDALQRYDAMVRAETAARSCRVRLDPLQEQRFAAVLSQAEAEAAGQLANAPGAPANQSAVWQELGARRAANEQDAASLARQRGCRSGPVEELIGAYRNFAALG
ncbi:hypothetical protein KXS07_12305 [Inquilinus limosus]|uniref:hypothetical protein n=1 Tax=Inquilinus limosus TaxID=171674 RepID=UPI003F155BE0